MRKSIALILGALSLAFVPAVGAANIQNLTDGLTTFVDKATGSLPFASAAGLDWSDSYIGSIVGVPPHFGLGIVAGGTTIPGKTVKPLIDALGGPSLSGDLFIPLAAVNGRIGGFMLPFDVGLKVSIVPTLTLDKYEITYQNYGFDVRYAVFEGGLVLPTVSVGAGVDYFSTKVKGTYGSALDYTATPGTLHVGAPTATLDLSSVVFEAKAQGSWPLLIVTPYLGLSALVGSSTAKAGVSSQITSSTGNVNDWLSYLPGVTPTGFSKDKSVTNFGLKVYGGTSINIVVVKLDLQGMYSLLEGSYGGSLGVRFQL